MPRIVVKSATVVEETNSKTGEIIRKQMAGLDLGNGYELPFSVGLAKRPPYPVGEYDIDPASFGLNEYGALVLKRFVDLVPLKAAGSSAKA
jgi:Helix-destabilising protein.